MGRVPYLKTKATVENNLGQRLTLSDRRAPPRKGTGESSVGGTPAWLPVLVTIVLQLRRKLKSA